MTKQICIRVRSTKRRSRENCEFCSTNGIKLRPCFKTRCTFLVTLKAYCIKRGTKRGPNIDVLHKSLSETQLKWTYAA